MKSLTQQAASLADKHSEAMLQEFGEINGTILGLAVADLIGAARVTGSPTRAMRFVVNQLEEVTSVAERNGWT
jgi:hypothetical protein